MSESTPERIRALHAWYCENVMDVPLRPEVERLWFEFFQQGYNGHQLAHVIRYLRKQITREKRNQGALKLSNLLERSEDGSLLKFAEDLGLAGYRRRPMSALPVSEPGGVGTRVVGSASQGMQGSSPPAAPISPATFQAGESVDEMCQRRIRELEELKRSLGGGLRTDQTPATEERAPKPKGFIG